jgi:hypothetical protein
MNPKAREMIDCPADIWQTSRKLAIMNWTIHHCVALWKPESWKEINTSFNNASHVEFHFVRTQQITASGHADRKDLQEEQGGEGESEQQSDIFSKSLLARAI